MARKSKGTKRKPKVQITPRDYRFPGESNIYWTGVAGIFILFVWIVIMFLMFKKKASGLPEWQWAYLVLWPIGSILLANFLSARPRLVQIKKTGRQARVMSQTNPDLYNRLAEQSQLLGFNKQPGLYIMDDDAAFIHSIPGRPGSVIASKMLLNALTPDEFGALLARELGTLAAHNARLDLAITWIRNVNPLLKVALFPLLLMSMFMRGWVDLTQLTADRAAVLLTDSESTVNLALVKQVIAQDPQADIGHEDLEAYLKGSADISADSAQLERHFRIGTFIEGQPNLKDRVEQIREYRKSDQGQRAFGKLAEMRSGSGTAPTT